MTNDPMGMRASDHDRQQVVERLRAGIEDGRLQMEEYVERVGRAYQAVTYGDLAPWLTVVSINVVIWALVSATGGHLAYPWPAWVAGPYGAVLFAVSVCVIQGRRGLRQAVR